MIVASLHEDKIAVEVEYDVPTSSTTYTTVRAVVTRKRNQLVSAEDDLAAAVRQCAAVARSFE